MVLQKLANAHSKRCSDAALATLNVLQDYRPEEQLAASTALFIILSEQMGAQPHEVYSMVKNIIAFRDKQKFKEFNAIRAYVQNEIIDKI